MTLRTLHDTKPTAPDWVLLANAARARCFERDADNGALRELKDFVHPDSRRKAGELAADRGGHVHKGVASTQFDPHTPVHAKEMDRFARELATHLDQAALAQRYAHLAVLASTPFLGHLRRALGAAGRRVTAAVALDLTAYDGAELEARVSAALREAGGATAADTEG